MIQIGCVKLSLLSGEYLSSAVNELTVMTFCISLRVTFSNSISLLVINKDDKGAAVMILDVFERLYHVACGRVL